MRHLTDLAARHLIVEYAPDRFRFHDLVHVFTRHYATPTIAASDRAGALHRLVDYYLRAADRLITPHRYRVPLGVLDRALALPWFAEYDDALAWLTTEETNLTDVCLAAGQAGLDIACWQLAYTLRGYFFLTKSRHPWIATHTTVRENRVSQGREYQHPKQQSTRDDCDQRLCPRGNETPNWQRYPT